MEIWKKRINWILILAIALGFLPLGKVQAALLSFSGGITATGTAPFDSLDPSDTNVLVRSHDYVSYRYTYVTSSTGLGNDSQIVLDLVDGTAPNNYLGASLGHTMTWFQIPASCENPVYPPEVPGENESGILNDGQRLICYLGDINTAQQQTVDFRARLLGHVPNGTILPPPAATIAAEGVDPITATENTAGELLGLPDLTTRAEPRWDFAISQTNNGVFRFLPASGPTGEDGVIATYRLGVKLNGSRIGAEALYGPISVVMDLSGLPDDAQVLDWPSGGPVNEPTGCKSLNGSDYPFESAYNQIEDAGPNDSTQPDHVSNGGACQAAQPGVPGTPVEVVIDGYDSSLLHYPIYRVTTQAPIINPTNLNDPSNRWYIINKVVYLWIPIENFDYGLHTFPISIQTTAFSVTGQENIDEGNGPDPDGNNVRSDPFLHEQSGSFNKVFSVLSNQGGIFAPRDPNITGDSHVTTIEPTQLFTTRLLISNGGTQDFTDVEICEKIDNSRLSVFDIRLEPGRYHSNYNLNTGLASSTRDLTAWYDQPTPDDLFTVEWGVGPPWESLNITQNKYGTPSKSGSAHADGSCSDPGITWYSDINQVPDVQDITHVRISVDVLEPTQRLSFFIAMKVRETFYYDGLDILPDGSSRAFSSGDDLIGEFSPNQAYVIFGNPDITAQRSDIMEITTTSYALITKSAEGHPNNSLVTGGEIITYTLQPNLTSPGGVVIPTDVVVTDVLPPGLTYVNGSATVGGSPVNDPVIQEDTPAAGYLTMTFTLPNQSPALGSVGIAEGDLAPIQFDAIINMQSVDGDNVLNAATITSENSGYSICVYNLGDDPTDPQDDAGYQHPDGTTVDCQYSHLTLEVDNPPGFRINKYASQSNIELNDSFGYNLQYSAIGAPLQDLRLIDILPYNGDGRTPPTAFQGTLTFSGAQLPENDALADIRYTRNDPGNINNDPYHNSNVVLDGTGTNGTERTVWCQEAQFGTGNCPNSLDEVTAILIMPNPRLPANTVYTVNLLFATEGNAVDNLYTNNYSAGSVEFQDVLLSNDVTVHVLAASLSGKVYLDQNANGMYDAAEGERGIANVEIRMQCLEGPSCQPGTLFSTLTDADGEYHFFPGAVDIYAGTINEGALIDTFPGLLSGLWQVMEQQPEGYIDGEDSAGNLGGSVENDEITAISMPVGGVGTDYNFGERLNGSIGDLVWADFNKNGVQDIDEPGLGNVSLILVGQLLGGDELTRAAVTDADGFYLFEDVPFGDYTVSVSESSLPPNVTPTYDLDGLTTPNEATVQIAESTLDWRTVDFGYATDQALSSISGFVYYDMNNDGVMDPGEEGISDVKITVRCVEGTYCADTMVYSTMTDADGAFRFVPNASQIYYGADIDQQMLLADFSGLPAGRWLVEEQQPEIYEDGIDTPGTLGGEVGDDTFIIDLPAGAASEENLFGEWLFFEPDIVIPATGFPPGVQTNVGGDQGLLSDREQTSGMTLSIPALNVTAAVTGVPFNPEDSSWEVSWLTGVGWLEGTAYPTWQGRTVLTAHNYNAAGLPGPFHQLANLKFGDLIELTILGETTYYAVTQVKIVPYWQSSAAFSHKEGDVLTLVSCVGLYSENAGYRNRVIVEAVPVMPDK